MREFDYKENIKIHTALTFIRLTVLAEVLKLSPENKEKERLKKSYEEGSKIYFLITGFRWPELFSQKDFIELFFWAARIYFLSPEINKQMKIVYENFPEEMEKIRKQDMQFSFYLTQQQEISQ